MSMTSPPLDLLIIGAGPVGLATAAAALQRGAKNILVVEQASHFRPAGQIIDLLPNAYRFLCQIAPDIEPSLQPFRHKDCPDKPRFLQLSADGTPIAPIDTVVHGPSASLLWWQLQKLLLDVLPQDIIVLNHQLVDIVHDDQKGIVYANFVPDRQRENRFKNWMGDPDINVDHVSPDALQKQSHALSSQHFVPTAEGQNLISCAAKFIVAADGINSVARKCVYRDTCPVWENYADALYSGLSMLGSTAPPGVIPEDLHLSLDYVDKANIVVLTCNPDVVAFNPLRIMVLHNDSDAKSRIEWALIYHMPIDEHTARNAPDSEIQSYIIDKCRESGFSEDIASLARQLWESGDSSKFRRPNSIVPAAHPPPYKPHPTADILDYPEDFKRPWYYGRVVLVGDAIHGMPPALAQGTAMGFEDVYVLTEALSSRGVWSGDENNGVQQEVLEQAFEEYYARRIDRVCFLQKQVMNRTSEHDIEKTQQVREVIWNYGPGSVK